MSLFIFFGIIKKRDNMKLIIENLDHQGRGIAKQNEKVYFIENALPNEEVEVVITKQKKNLIEGKVTKYYKKNEENRVEPLCPYYGICGGCSIMHIKNQNKYKLDKLNNIINKYVDKNIEIKEVESLNKYNYRNKITLQVKDNTLGLYKKESNDILEGEKVIRNESKNNETVAKKKYSEDIQTIATLEDEITTNSVWCGTFQLVWNDMVNNVVKQNVVFTPQEKIVENLNKQTFKEDQLSEKDYYKVYDLLTLELKEKIEKAIEEKFNEKSDILDSIDWSKAPKDASRIYRKL